MNTEQNPLPEKFPAPLPTVEEEIPAKENKDVWVKVGLIAGAIVVIALLVGSIVLLLQSGSETTAKVRDIFIIFMALEFLIIGLALVILIIQLARLINLLQNEVKPILDSTNETANTLRGTTQFLSDHLVEPVIKLNEYLASLQSLLKVFRPKGR